MKQIIYSIIFIVCINPMPAVVIPDGWSNKTLSTSTMDVHLSNTGILDWLYSDYAISHQGYTDGSESVVFNHNLWFTGYKNDVLIGEANSYLFTFSPGPIINGMAAMEAYPENSQEYRIFYINQESQTGHPDYDEWPAHLGAPVHEDGSPKIYGSQTAFMVYNDAHTGDDYRGYPFSDPTGLEIAETVWSYDYSPSLDKSVFFRYRIHNRDSVDYQNVTFGLWSDMDIAFANYNWGGYNAEHNFMYTYWWDNSLEQYMPRAAAYVMLQGPMVPTPGETGKSFESSYSDYSNLDVTSGWYIYTESISSPDELGSSPSSLEEVRYLSTGLMVNGDPIVNPLTGETTSFTFDGDPVTGEGWLFNNEVPEGGSGILSSSGTFNLEAGDSTEIIYALVMTEGTQYQEALTTLYEDVGQLRHWWENHQLSSDEFILPGSYSFIHAYPNPFNPTTMIQYTLKSKGPAMIQIFDVNGRLIETLVDGIIQAGAHDIQWNAGQQPSGVYFVKLTYGNKIKTQKIMLLK